MDGSRELGRRRAPAQIVEPLDLLLVAPGMKRDVNSCR